MYKFNKKIFLTIVALCTFFICTEVVNAESRVSFDVIENNSFKMIDYNNDGWWNIGDEIIIGDESFYVFSLPEDVGIFMAKYNINTTTLKQSETDASTILDQSYNTQAYLDKYKEKVEESGIKIKSISNPTRTILKKRGCDDNGICNNTPEFIYSQSYFLDTGYYMIKGAARYTNEPSSVPLDLGIRPAIVLDDIEYHRNYIFMDGEEIIGFGRNNLVKLTITPEEGKKVKSVILKNRLTDEEVEIDENNQFYVPEYDMDLIIEYEDEENQGNTGNTGENTGGNNGNTNPDNSETTGGNTNTGGNLNNINNSNPENTIITNDVPIPNTADNINTYIIELIISLSLMLFLIRNLNKSHTNTN